MSPFGVFSDYKFRSCSLAAQGLWWSLVPCMIKGKPKGYLIVDDYVYDVPTIKCVSGQYSSQTRTVEKLLAELIDRGALAKTSDGVFYSPFLVDEVQRSTRRELDVSSGQWQRLRRAVLARDGWSCTYCGATDEPLECDHVIPVTRGGTSDLDNLVTACKPCNASKGALLPQEWRGRASV